MSAKSGEQYEAALSLLLPIITHVITVDTPWNLCYRQRNLILRVMELLGRMSSISENSALLMEASPALYTSVVNLLLTNHTLADPLVSDASILSGDVVGRHRPPLVTLQPPVSFFFNDLADIEMRDMVLDVLYMMCGSSANVQLRLLAEVPNCIQLIHRVIVASSSSIGGYSNVTGHPFTMKLEEAAAILGVSLEDITVDGLKKTYKKLALAWDPEKCKDHASRQKYIQISEAYKKLNAVMEGGELRGDDSHEIAAFMRMFMDMVGISDSDSLPAAMTFGMMFGTKNNSMEDWSTDEDGDYDEDDDDEYEYVHEEYYDENSNIDGNWEPQAKQYSNMNLKDQVSKERLQILQEKCCDEEAMELERERKLKQAKKRAEKRKKQKEKRVKEAAFQKSVDGGLKSADESKSRSEHSHLNTQDAKRLITLHKDHIKMDLINAITNGHLGKVVQILSFDYSEAMPQMVSNRIAAMLREEIPNCFLLHHCVTDFYAKGAMEPRHKTNASAVAVLASKRLEVAKYLLVFNNPVINLGATDFDGLTVLHLSILSGDLEFTKLIFFAWSEQNGRKGQLNLNTRCQKRGWAPIHYAVDRSDLMAFHFLVHAGANLNISVTLDKKVTLTELAKQRLKSTHISCAHNPKLTPTGQIIYEELVQVLGKDKKDAMAVKEAPAQQAGVGSPTSSPPREKEAASTVVVPVPAPMAKADDAAAPAVETTNTAAKSGSAEKAPLAVEAKSDAKKKKKKDKKPAEAPKSKQVAPPAAATSSQPSAALAEISIASRDEMVDRLLAMGFREQDCLTAISLYGTDLDRALSYLCDLPAAAPAPLPPAAAPAAPSSASKVVPKPSGISTATKADDRKQPQAQKKPTMDVKPVSPSAHLGTVASSSANAAKLQKEKEELRRINKAWNMKAEEEKRKVTAELLKKQAEQEKLQEQARQKAAVQVQQQQMPPLQKWDHATKPPLGAPWEESSSTDNTTFTGFSDSSTFAAFNGASAKHAPGFDSARKVRGSGNAFPLPAASPVTVEASAAQMAAAEASDGTEMSSMSTNSMTLNDSHGSMDSSFLSAGAQNSLFNPYGGKLFGQVLPPQQSYVAAPYNPSYGYDASLAASLFAGEDAPFVDGAVELSAGAKPFVPKSFGRPQGTAAPVGAKVPESAGPRMGGLFPAPGGLSGPPVIHPTGQGVPPNAGASMMFNPAPGLQLPMPPLGAVQRSPNLGGIMGSSPWLGMESFPSNFMLPSAHPNSAAIGNNNLSASLGLLDSKNGDYLQNYLSSSDLNFDGVLGGFDGDYDMNDAISSLLHTDQHEFK